MSVREMAVGTLLIGAMAGMPAIALAHAEHAEEDIKLLRDAAAALGPSHPDLAMGLSDYADREAEELEEATEEAEAGETVEPEDERGEDTKY